MSSHKIMIGEYIFIDMDLEVNLVYYEWEKYI